MTASCRQQFLWKETQRRREDSNFCNRRILGKNFPAEEIGWSRNKVGTKYLFGTKETENQTVVLERFRV